MHRVSVLLRIGLLNKNSPPVIARRRIHLEGNIQSVQSETKNAKRKLLCTLHFAF
jgi:hypothetical protein